MKLNIIILINEVKFVLSIYKYIRCLNSGGN